MARIAPPLALPVDAGGGHRGGTAEENPPPWPKERPHWPSPPILPAPLHANAPSPHHRCRTLPLVDIITKRPWGQIRCRFPGHTTKNYQQNTLSLTDTGHVQTTKDKQTNPITQSAKGNATYSTRRRDIPTRRSRGICTYCK